LRPVEVGLLAAVGSVLVAGLVSLGTIDSDDHGPRTTTPVPTPSVSPAPPPLTAGTMRVGTFAPGSESLVFTATVVADDTLLAQLRSSKRVVTLTVTAVGSGRQTVSGRVPLDCAAAPESFDLVLSRGDDQLVVPVPAAQLAAARKSACSEPAPVTAPTVPTTPK
jgi:hypothetical protein